MGDKLMVRIPTLILDKARLESLTKHQKIKFICVVELDGNKVTQETVVTVLPRQRDCTFAFSSRVELPMTGGSDKLTITLYLFEKTSMNAIVVQDIMLSQRFKSGQRVCDALLDFTPSKGGCKLGGRMIVRLQREVADGSTPVVSSTSSTSSSSSSSSLGSYTSPAGEVAEENLSDDEDEDNILSESRKKIDKMKKTLKKIQQISGKTNSQEQGPRLFGRRLLPDDEIPEVIKFCIELIEERQELNTKGLFRETASVAEVEGIVQRWEANEKIDWSVITNPHVVGGVMMQYLLRLPEPIITYELYNRILATETSNNIETQMKIMRELLNELPRSHYDILEFLLSFMEEMTQYAETSMMSASNLAIVFGPALMHKEEEDIAQLMRDSPIIVRVVTEMVRQYGFLFQGEPLKKFGDGEDGKGGGSSEVEKKRPPIDQIFQKLNTVKLSLGNIQKALQETERWDETSLSVLCVLIPKIPSILENPAPITWNEKECSTVRAVVQKLGSKKACLRLTSQIENGLFLLSKWHHCALKTRVWTDDMYVAAESITNIWERASLLVHLSPFIDIKTKVDVSVSIVKRMIVQLEKDLVSCESTEDASIVSLYFRQLFQCIKQQDPSLLPSLLRPFRTSPAIHHDRLKATSALFSLLQKQTFALLDSNVSLSSSPSTTLDFLETLEKSLSDFLFFDPNQDILAMIDGGEDDGMFGADPFAPSEKRVQIGARHDDLFIPEQ